ncbi:MAG: hypothetical protein O6914_08700 [Chloroflexi bacterium]|nr:hypothetical protein [Chloroflexota bacterium]
MAQDVTEQAIVESLMQVEQRLEANRTAESKLIDLYTRGGVSPDVFPRNKGTLKAERTWCEEEIERLHQQVGGVRDKFVTLEQVNALRRRLGEKLVKATPENRRFVLEALETQVVSRADGSLNVTLAMPETAPGTVLTDPRNCPHKIPEAIGKCSKELLS